MQGTLSVKFQVPDDAPPRLLQDIQDYSALVELQNKMRVTSPWFERLA